MRAWAACSRGPVHVAEDFYRCNLLNSFEFEGHEDMGNISSENGIDDGVHAVLDGEHAMPGFKYLVASGQGFYRIIQYTMLQSKNHGSTRACESLQQSSISP